MFPAFSKKTPKLRGENGTFVLVLSTKGKKRNGSGDSSCRVWLRREQQSGNNKMSQSARKTGGF